jgi:hypothetical protein
MFYARINKIKVFNNREGFLGLFDRAEMRIYSYVSASSAGEGATFAPLPQPGQPPIRCPLPTNSGAKGC